ncbi:MAG: lysine 2,3-aminomutase [Desulfobacterales bacterium SG8_35]|nr:MAG: lysine 2,3-aminomutase [Desulfobacterales bacterium SG8_35]
MEASVELKWQDELNNNVTTLEELKEYIDLDALEERKLQKVIDEHPMSIPRYYLSLIDPSDPDDPIRKMAVPSLDELDLDGSYDTSGERKNTILPGLQHKYTNTVLLLSANICSMYCRHCFRKRMVGLSNDEIIGRFHEAYEYIAKHPEVNNVLISGGDSLILPTHVLGHFLAELSRLDHLDYIRFGTRMAVTFPDRILKDPELPELFRAYSKKDRRIYLHTQFNHPREITEQAIEAVHRVIKSGVVVNNQTVLLRDVNDTPEVLADLQRNLVRIGVNPYYVFQCRPVKRVKNHFQIPLAEGYRIVAQARGMLDGLSKRFRYVMSHENGKIEILGILGKEMFFKHQQARDQNDVGRFFKRGLDEQAGWLDELPE